MDNYRPLEESLKGKAVLVTGGTYGIAKSIVEAFCYAGSRVIFCARNEEKGRENAKRFSRKYKTECVFLHCDVTDYAEIEQVVEETAKRFNGIDILINCAGYWPAQLPIDEPTIEDFNKLLQTNMVAYYAFCKYALPYIRAAKGNIVNIGSVIGMTGKEGAAMYCSTKGAIDSMTKALAVDEARNCVRVNEVKPGHIKNEGFYETLENSEAPESFQEYSDGLQWMGRGGTTDEVARAVLFMASDWASFITGASLVVSGGYEIGEGRKAPLYHWDSMEIKSV